MITFGSYTAPSRRVRAEPFVEMLNATPAAAVAHDDPIVDLRAYLPSVILRKAVGKRRCVPVRHRQRELGSVGCHANAGGINHATRMRTDVGLCTRMAGPPPRNISQ